MLHLRFHRRAPSNPTSPVTDAATWDTSSLLTASNLVPDNGVPLPDIRPRSATTAPQQQHYQREQVQQQAPVLPPITRVVSSDSAFSGDLDAFSPQQPDNTDMKALPRSPYNEQSGFIGGMALQNYRREQRTAQTDPPPNRTATTTAPVPSVPPPMPANNRPPPPLRVLKTAPSFVSPTDLQNASPTGKRPPGARMVSELPVPSSSVAAPETSRAKKALPFLKNPMSTLLLRRKPAQNTPDLTLPLRKEPDEPIYDPQITIRGTRVHDFSAPRPKKPPILSNKVADEPLNDVNQSAPQDEDESGVQTPVAPPVPPKDEPTRSSRASSSYSNRRSVDHPLAHKPRDSSVQFVDAPTAVEDTAESDKSSTLQRDSFSRSGSKVSTKSTMSAMPRHMKSTSSRFSFDMIGAAEQEKLLEERHRQRQQDKEADEPLDRRDSRFDEFDEDGFDYDAMYEDDGFEERIPGVNADFEDEDGFETAQDDPDDDQENFAGFVFQRSNPVSSLTSPHSAGLLPTPRDASGKVIGYAMTGETPELDQFPDPPSGHSFEQESHIDTENVPAGLGIQRQEPLLEVPALVSPPASEPHLTATRQLDKDDELYFNDGLIHDFDGEGDGSNFDESIFDLVDTDQYGRPIPGMFAHNLAQRNANAEIKKRESDGTSRMSAQSGVSQSTAHTSLSVDTRSRSLDVQDYSQPGYDTQESSQKAPGLDEETVAAYQAALAAAAHKAAASGKFRRDSSPPPPAELTITSPTTSGSSRAQSEAVSEAIDDYEYNDDFASGLDDYELDDDAIIAEANASALANDQDGWYGQEFGFYSAPVTQTNHSNNLLSEKNVYQYSSGGYFGPSGVNRTTSGRVVSREPNLTPITERSEYSNRNSLMSLGWPPAPNSGSQIQSPGLAQLAMMADDHDMSLSSLLRLRNKAWGGSQASLSSSRDGSPYDRNGATSPWSQEISGAMAPPKRKNSAFSIYSQESTGPGSESGSPTLTSMSLPSIPTNMIPPVVLSANSVPYSSTSMQSSATFPPVTEDEEPETPTALGEPVAPLSDSMVPKVGKPSQQYPGVGHRHKGSADSISYIKEEEGGQTRWILERRRTAESGEIEILERELVGGGRI
ncbi:hypothetical protein F5Y16DRAFT_341306 [Xylariaceae sp. FL0255]|nr:hypothetical protein F5Y16DRAFT_341306 [Xylariaceae sp. FL0255]